MNSCSSAQASLFRSAWFALVLFAPALFSAEAPALEFKSLFNGQDLTGWEGNDGFWTVEQGAITGRTSVEHPLKQNTFLIWQGGTPGNFDLKMKIRLEGNNSVKFANSGVQYRSRIVDFANHVMAGYQADLDLEGKYVGMLYEEKGRGILAKPGERVTLITNEGKPAIKLEGSTATAEEIAALAAAVTRGDWLSYQIIARGNRVQHFVNGIKTAEYVDLDKLRSAAAGLIGLQLHMGQPMLAQFKDIELGTTGAILPVKPPVAAPGAAAAKMTSVTKPAETMDTPDLEVAPGFKAELLYSVPKATQGTWVCLTVDDRGRLIAGDQTGGFYRMTPPAVGSRATPVVERLPSVLYGAQGLLWAFDSLYVMVNQNLEAATGLWRMKSSKGDDQLDDVKLLREMRGTGEHGPHAVVLGPDGKSIYFTSGNHTVTPMNLNGTRMIGWGEDHLLPRMWDANGHAKEVYAPGGYIGRTDPDGKSVELVSIGFRNTYDFAFDQNGEMITYDSDMEWDQGSPWYVPTRLNHAVDGADFGWRSGAGRWPDYFADSLPSILDVGPGSPTGVTFGTGAKFPAKYQRAFFACDWTYGTLYAMHLKPAGATFTAEKEEFVAGKALSLTDLVINPKDGAMYFTTGGRNNDSALFRVTYVGKESTTPVGAIAPTPEAKLRRSLEALHVKGLGEPAIAQAWPVLDSPDRFLRFAARIAIEFQPPNLWSERALAERRPQASLEALIALARMGDKSLQPRIIATLEGFDLGTMPENLRQPWLRAWELAFTRMGKPDAATCARLAKRFEGFFPYPDPLIDRELVALLVYLDSPTVIAKTVPLLKVREAKPVEMASGSLLDRNEGYGKVVREADQTRPDRQQIWYAYTLRTATAGWTPELHRNYFAWFPTTAGWKGGNSFGRFLQNIRNEALTGTVTDVVERGLLDEASKPRTGSSLAGITPAKGPGKPYTLDEAVALIQGGLKGRSYTQGRAMFSSGACIACHSVMGEGSRIGPDLSAAGDRYTLHDLLESIILPSKVVSDQYAAEQVELRDGTTLIGRVVGEEDGNLLIITNLLTPDNVTKVPTAQLKSRAASPLSLMPPGLINGMNEDELKDLVAFLLSSGNPRDAMFKVGK